MIKIILAEDDDLLRTMVKLMLSALYNVQVIEVANGKLAFDELKKNPDVDLIICDYAMPIWGAEDVYSAMKKDNIRLPFLLFSGGGYENSQILKNLMTDFPGNGILKKPVLRKDFDIAIRSAIPHKFHTPESIE